MDVDVDLGSLEIKDKKRSTPDEFDSPSKQIDALEGGNEPVTLRRSLRKRFRASNAFENAAIRVKPKKTDLDSSMKQITSYYLDKRVKRLPPSLETIFEEPKNSTALMSTRKFRRSINFPHIEDFRNNKVKKKAMKAKKVCTFKKLGKKKGMEMLMEKLSSINEEETEELN